MTKDFERRRLSLGSKAIFVILVAACAGVNFSFFLSVPNEESTYRSPLHIEEEIKQGDSERRSERKKKGKRVKGMRRNSGNLNPPVKSSKRKWAREKKTPPRSDRRGDTKHIVKPEGQSLKRGKLSCEKYGGPPDEIASEMVYWSDIPSDADLVSPFKKEGDVRYMTFEPDPGGWNNIRMSMETMVALAHAMGRTLVMPPKQRLYLLSEELGNQSTRFGFADFFNLEELDAEHLGLNIVSTKHFLEKEAMTGRLVSKETKKVAFPPANRTNWDGESEDFDGNLANYLRDIAVTPEWKDEECMAVFPASEGNTAFMKLRYEIIKKEGFPSVAKMAEKPLPVDASTVDRMRELILGRSLCIYDEEMQKAPVIHFMVDDKKDLRLLVHFYAFIFFEDWHHDLHLKRLIRDHLRYLDELQCAAARVVAAVRDRARKRNPISNPKGIFNSMHIRRGDFQYKETRLDAKVLYESSKKELMENSTLYISTDEKNRSFFQPFFDHHDVCFLDEFKPLFHNLNTGYFGMLDQLIASRGEIFYGTWFSTFTGYINRLRGYAHSRQKLEGYEKGKIRSYYFFPPEQKRVMRHYTPVHMPFWQREFPAAWRDIDKGIFIEGSS